MSIQDIEKKLTEYFSDKARFVLLFGSAKVGLKNPESDIDIAVYYNEPRTASEYFADEEKLGASLHRKVDLIYLNQNDIIITMQVLANGRIVYCADKSFFNIFKAQKISEYIDFKRSRKIIEENLLRKRSDA